MIKDGKASIVKQIENYLDKADILDDLDVKASDLLQANGIIWVEGPSDRIYIKRWLEVFGGNDVQEGRDYQFAYYGGRLLSHYSVEEDAKDLINILLINRNSAIVIDSDKRSHATSLNATKKRVISEFQEKKLFAWVTKGKEIENYVAYTFYCKNNGQETLDYNAYLEITGVAKSADEATRVMVYKNGKPAIYGKGKFDDRNTAETDCTKFVDDTTVMTTMTEDFEVDDVDKYTIVIWIEGNDPECLDDIRNGHVRMRMLFDVIDDEAPTAFMENVFN